MPPVATNRTAWLDASDTDRLWKEVDSDSPWTNHPADGEPVKAWDDEVGDVNMSFQVQADDVNVAPLYRAGAFNSLGCLDFDGSNDRLEAYNDGWGGARNLDVFFNAGAGTVWMSFLAQAVTSTSHTYAADTLIAEGGGYWGLFIRNNSGTYLVFAYIYSGGSVYTTGVPILLNTKYVVQFKWNGTTVSVTVNDGTPNTASCGAIDSVTASPNIGKTTGAFSGYIGEIVTYDSHQTGTDEDDNWTYLMNKWVNAAATGHPTVSRFAGVPYARAGSGLYVPSHLGRQ